ncbi:MAG: SGNH hydrolase-type esterase domain-containing protein [Monoraphidium minutum]|nr:MAG: SGNH hydrolase-type esterase domain-containing protein [Monoraphidium minutum]
MQVDVNNAGVGGAGIFASGFRNPTTLLPWLREQLSRGVQYDWVIALMGINDLLREGKPADQIMAGLQEVYLQSLLSGANVMAIAPLPAPGFVSQSDFKEGERLKLHDLIRGAAQTWNSQNPMGPMFIVGDLGVEGPMDFWKMSPRERGQWLDDGLHLTPKGYDWMGRLIADDLFSMIRK